jgi:uncharacterized Ntn-hydrolase superfamily protein
MVDEESFMDITKVNGFSGTFSIIAISADSGLMGIAVASGSTSVGDRVPHAKPRIGVVATQAYTNVNYGIDGLELLSRGLSPQEALNKLFEEDSERNLRQVAIMDFKRRKAVFTGANVSTYSAEIVGKDYIAIGNLLFKKEVISNMAQQFKSSSGDLAMRLTGALRAASQSGGDRRGEKSAALIVISTERVEIDIKVDAHANPIEELLRKLKNQFKQHKNAFLSKNSYI